MSHSRFHSESLLRKAREGDKQALDSLLGGYRNYLKLLSRSQVGRQLRTKLDPSDLVQDTLVDAYRNFDGFRGQSAGELIAWLRKILVRNLLDQSKHYHAQRRDVHRERSLEAAIDRSSVAIAEALDVQDTSPSAQLTREEKLVAVAEALARLPRDCREAIILRQMEGYSFDAIAERMGKSASSVRYTWTKGLDLLRRELERWE